MGRRSLVVIAALAAGCGRIGYDATSGEVAGIDGAPASDSATRIDGTPDALGAVQRIADGCTNPTRLGERCAPGGEPQGSRLPVGDPAAGRAAVRHVSRVLRGDAPRVAARPRPPGVDAATLAD
jgi:hypothetical protein